MTLEELWQLFPIVLAPHDSCWNEWAEEEINLLRNTLGEFKPVISHIGSTAIPNIQAKPIVDILVDVPEASDWNKLHDVMVHSGYICMSESVNRMSFNKGYTPAGYAEKVFHIHVHLIGDNDEVFFRDYLIAHPDLAKEYEKLKMNLLPAFKHDRDGYTEAKTEFIQRVIKRQSTDQGFHFGEKKAIINKHNNYLKDDKSELS